MTGAVYTAEEDDMEEDNLPGAMSPEGYSSGDERIPFATPEQAASVQVWGLNALKMALRLHDKMCACIGKQSMNRLGD